MPRRTLNVLCLLGVLATSCAANDGVHLTTAEIGSLGTRSFAAEPDAVFRAALAALRSQGYEVVYQDPQRGLIKTGKKLIRTYSETEGLTFGLIDESQATTTTTQAFRSYTLQVKAIAPHQTGVEAVPRVFLGERDASSDEVWDLDGPVGERVLWRQLFDDLASVL